MQKKVIILLLLVSLVSACIKEDMDKCMGKMRWYFQYTYNNQRQDQLARQVGNIRIYLFDQTTGKLTDIIQVNKKDIIRGWIEPDIPTGLYTAVAWATSGEEITLGGYREAGITTLDEFRVMLNCRALAESIPGEATPMQQQFDDLFFAIATDVLVTTSNGRTVEFDFIKNTNMLKVKVTGLEYLTRAIPSEQPLCVFVTGPHESYLYNNRIDANTREVHYEPPYTALTATSMDFDIKIQRLDIDYHTLHPVLLYIRSKGTVQQDMVIPINIMDAILQTKDAQGKFVWKNQEDIDCQEEFPIEVSILHDLSIRVSVNGFEIIDTKPEIGRD
ncbi:FimB/Mfa2 family fimbrial subunit [Bacteroides sp. 224]|uniref:FimB/Mfa2 family fimbrial subunit n=1 Tax=Bacteroides sp. 224 TaxID=2302936 RepID=UPI0013D57F74|nr:FimB/Mfa2 family fimbrial subunit [Bacteroides sp. 224]